MEYPQGTALGPTFFVFYISDIMKIIKECNIQLFADDTSIYLIGAMVQDLTDPLNEDRSNLLEWLNDNLLGLNLYKTKVMII